MSWRTHGVTTHGVVERVIAQRIEVGMEAGIEAAGRTVDASEDEPQYLVRSSKSRETAVHKASALSKTQR